MGYFSSAIAYEVMPVEKGGEISGMVTLKGSPPVMPSRKVMRDTQVCGETTADETFMVNPSTKGLQNIVVCIEGVALGKGYLPTTVLLDNFKCHFQPRAIVAMIGDSYEVRNSDPVLHNTHLRLNDATILNVAMPPSDRNIIKPLNHVGSITVNCEAYAFMKGIIMVFDHPYFAVTDEEVSFIITGIPLLTTYNWDDLVRFRRS